MTRRVISDLRRTLYRTATGALTLAALPLRSQGIVAPFYGGAIAGDAGGPLIKVRTLTGRFPERRFGYSLFYILSNAIYIPQAILDTAHRAGVPIVLNQNGVFYPSWYPDAWKRENERMAAVHASATHVLYQSEFCRRAAHCFLGERTGAAEVLYNAVDTTRFSPGEPRNDRQPFTALVSGKFVPSTSYRIRYAIEAIAAARRGGLDSRLTIAGWLESSVEKEARELASHLGVDAHVRYVGLYSWRDAPQLYRSADAYLMTKHNDPCPNVVLEALACGLPVLYLNSGGVPELVGSDAGVAIPVEDTFDHIPTPRPEELAQGLATIMATRETKSVAARARAVARFDLAGWLDRHEQLFAQLVSASESRGRV